MGTLQTGAYTQATEDRCVPRGAEQQLRGQESAVQQVREGPPDVTLGTAEDGVNQDVCGGRASKLLEEKTGAMASCTRPTGVTQGKAQSGWEMCAVPHCMHESL